MTFIDTLMLILAAAAVIIGYCRGMVSQIVSVGGFVLGIIAARTLGGVATEILVRVLPESDSWPMASTTQSIVAHIALFLLVLLTVRVAGMFVRSLVRSLHLGVFERLGGSAVCLVKYFFLLSALLNLWFVVSPKSEIFTSEKMLNGKPFEMTMKLAPMCLGTMSGDADSANDVQSENEEPEEAK